MKWLLVLFTLFAFALAAADVSGTWKGMADTPNGKIERTFVFKVDGSKLTGETSSEMTGKSEIREGKVDGDTITFNIVAKIQDNEIKLIYKGKVSGDEIKMTAEAPDQGFSVEYAVKRVP
jgi:hypothetical protein